MHKYGHMGQGTEYNMVNKSLMPNDYNQAKSKSNV